MILSGLMTYWLRNTTIFGFVGSLFLLPVVCVAAPDFIPLVGIPGLEAGSSEKPSIQRYIDALYTLSISVAAFLAVVKIISGGVQYALSDIVTSKESAKQEIRGAILGLLLILGAVTILNEINPELRELNFLRNAQRAEVNIKEDNIPATCAIINSDGSCQVTKEQVKKNTVIISDSVPGVTTEELVENFAAEVTVTRDQALSGVFFSELIKAERVRLGKEKCEGRGTLPVSEPHVGFGTVQIFCKP